MDQTPASESAVPTQESNAAPVTETRESPVLMGVLAYLGLLVLIPLFVAKEDAFVRFHVKQGLVLLIIEVVLYIADYSVRMDFLELIFGILHIGVIALSLIGIVHVLHRKEKELPLVGGYATHIDI